MKEFFIKSDKFLRNINEGIERLHKKLLISINNPLTYIIILIASLLICIGIKILFYQDHNDAILITFLTVITFILFIAGGVQYHKLNVRGTVLTEVDFKEEVKQSLQNSISQDEKEELLSRNEEAARPRAKRQILSSDHLDEIYQKIYEVGALDYKHLENEIDDTSIFSKEYFINSIEDLNQTNQTDSPLFFTANQKIVGAIIFDLIQPYLVTDSKTIAKHTHYLKSGKFVLVNYASIDSPKKRAILKNI